MKEKLKNEVENRLKDILDRLPNSPGVYQFFNNAGEIIYVGKAKNLKKRVSSYFLNRRDENKKLNILVRKIFDIRFIIVSSESDALLLENNLIKKFQPRYNILLKDDKTFPWICIKNERFPRVIITRNYLKDGSEYFGPYTSIVVVKTILDLVTKLYPLRTCNYDLTEGKISENKFKPCLEYHVGNCKAPCIAKQTIDEYIKNINVIKEILKGNLNGIIKYLKDLMNLYATELDYENASLIKEKIDIISNFQSKSTIVNNNINNVDVFSIINIKDDVCVNFLRVASGAIIQVHSVIMKRTLNEPLKEILSTTITDIRQKMLSNSSEIILSLVPDIKIPEIKYTIPKQGDKLKLLELSARNAQMFLNEKLKLTVSKTEKFKSKKESKMEQMKLDLQLSVIPNYIECFDNSNIQGTNPVAACVVFRFGLPSKNEYRHFNIKTVEGPDDFASMREIIFRRYKRLIDEKKNLPDLIVIDGGKGQLNAAIESLKKLNISEKVAIIGIAKKLEEIFYPNDPVPLYIDKNSPSLKIIQNLRNEAHRFGITFHRQKRSADMIRSEFDIIPGIGEKTKDELFRKFKSIDNIKSKPIDEIAEIIGKSKAIKVFEYFNSFQHTNQ